MIKMSKFAIIAAIAAVSIASPALAQSFNPRDGTGNMMPFSYGPGGSRVYMGSAAAPAPQQDQSGVHSFAQRDQSGLHSFAMLPRDVPGTSSVNPGATGGGSEGYNIRLLQH
jgi:hypothetical protein